MLTAVNEKGTNMNRDDIISLAETFISDSPNNYITEEIALSPKCVGIKIFDTPIFAFGSPDDDLYIKYKSFDAIGSHFLCPAEWLPSTKTVISFFLPYTNVIRKANSADNRFPADEWLHGRYEGQQLLAQMSEHLVNALVEAGYNSLAPSFDQRYNTGNVEKNIKNTSNWSERHVAFACGLGAFGLSKGLITKKGTCGRFGSILTELDLPKDGRDYNDIYEYCTMCGVCIYRCPVNAISLESGKQSELCREFLVKVGEMHNPRYGCGKCQTRVPCESRLPVK